ncbi:MAG: hypothetical protein WCI88_10520 [Chloroflexota bacterium]
MLAPTYFANKTPIASNPFPSKRRLRIPITLQSGCFKEALRRQQRLLGWGSAGGVWVLQSKLLVFGGTHTVEAEQIDFVQPDLLDESRHFMEMLRTVVVTGNERHAQDQPTLPSYSRRGTDIFQDQLVAAAGLRLVEVRVHVLEIDEQPIRPLHHFQQCLGFHMGAGLHRGVDIL